MLDLSDVQKDIYKHKLKQNFNVSDIPLEFTYIYGELGEAFEAYRKKLPSLGEELADVAIYLLGLAEILEVNLGEEIDAKMSKNKKREYTRIDGVLTRTKEA